MSTVYLSYDVAAGTPIAVKLLADHLAHSREFVGRFYREAHLSRLLSHPHLVRGSAAGYDRDSAKHYLILEYVDGPTTHAAMRLLGRFPTGAAVKVGIDIARALSYMHDRMYIHRDVKPENILLQQNGIAKLADLGLAKRLNDDSHLTSVSQGVGTSYYMSYEQSLNANLVDGRSDIFALGATLYHLLTGEVPFRGNTHEEIVREKEVDALFPVRERHPEVPVALAAILTRTLARDPRSRFQSAREFAEALEATGLATPIPPLPAFGGEVANESREADVQLPTRADLNAENCRGQKGPSLNRPEPSSSIVEDLLPTRLAAKKDSNSGSFGVRSFLGLLAVGGFALASVIHYRNLPRSTASIALPNAVRQADCPNDFDLRMGQ